VPVKSTNWWRIRAPAGRHLAIDGHSRGNRNHVLPHRIRGGPVDAACAPASAVLRGRVGEIDPLIRAQCTTASAALVSMINVVVCHVATFPFQT